MHDRIKDAFDKIHAEDEIKNHTKEFLFKKTHAYKKRTHLSYKWLLAAACFVLILLGGGSYYAYYMPMFTISVDVNPSIELEINRFDRVIAVEAYNEDGDTLLSSLNIYNLVYIDALSRILEDKCMEPYLTPEQLTTITVFGKNKEGQKKILAGITTCTASYKNIYCSSGNSEDAAKAHAAGLSLGKYKAFLELQELDPEITAEDVQGLTMRQIRDKINALSNSSDHTIQNNTEGNNGQGLGHGFGYGNGNGSGNSNDNSNGNGNSNSNGNGKGWGNGRGNSCQNHD